MSHKTGGGRFGLSNILAGLEDGQLQKPDFTSCVCPCELGTLAKDLPLDAHPPTPIPLEGFSFLKRIHNYINISKMGGSTLGDDPHSA